MSRRPRRPPPPPGPQKPYAKTEISGPDKIIRIVEDLRTLNTDGYDPYTPGLLAKIRGFKVGGVAQTKGTVCSPFTANVLGCALDPDYATKDPATDEFAPMFNGGHDPLPFWKFYKAHNNDGRTVGALTDFNVGEGVAPKDMRRGDVLGIGWKKGGHTAFCWDVHLDENGEVDCFQYVGCNGHLAGQLFDHDAAGLEQAKAKVKAGTNCPEVLGGRGVSIAGCGGKTWISGEPATYESKEKEVEIETRAIDPATGEKVKVKKYKVCAVARTKEGTLSKAKAEIFVDDAEISRRGHWHLLPGKAKGDIDEAFARGRTILDTVKSLKVGRLFYVNAPPAPSPHAPVDPSTPAKTPKRAGHAEAPAQVVKGRELAADPRAKDKVKPVPAKQTGARTLLWQHYVEQALQVFFATRWISVDPGKSEDINDPKTQAALRAYQALFGLEVDGKIGPKTLGSIIEQLPICTAQLGAQYLLAALFRAQKISTDPGRVDGTNHDATRAAVQEFQEAQGLRRTGVPDLKTYAKLREVVESHAPSAAKPGLEPRAASLYWVGNVVPPGGRARLRLHAVDLKSGERCAVHLRDEGTEATIEATVALLVTGTESEVEVPIPFPVGASVEARVVTESAGELTTAAALRVGRGTEPVDVRPYVDQESVPDEILEKVRRNRALWPEKKIPLVTKGKYAGPNHYDYKPPASHGKWAREYITTHKVEPAKTLAERHIAQVFVEMMKSERGSEGQPASMNTYDNQIVTWGVGFGGKGDGVHVFEHLGRDPRMRQLLDDLGVQYSGGRYHVVHLGERRVVSSKEVTKEVPGRGKRRGEKVKKRIRWDHVPPLDAWRAQKDALSAIIGISEDAAYREQILEAQWQVYLSNSTTWTGQDKIRSLALYYLVTHAQHWMPALARRGFHVDREWEAIGGVTPSFETDVALAQRLLNGFLAVGKEMWHATHPNRWKEVHGRVDTSLWARFAVDAKKEGFDAGEFVYTVDL